MTKIIFSGRIPMPQGAYDATKAYTINNLVAMYGMSFLANGDVAAGYAPAQLNQDGTVSLINTDKWTLFAGDPSAYNMKQYFDDTVEQITALIANKANIDGWYSTLTVGAAENLVGRGTTPAVISFRHAGGTQDIGTGVASIAKIKGRTDVWNQASRLGEHTTETINGVTFTNNDDGTFTVNGTANGTAILNISIPNVIPAGHKVAFLPGEHNGTSAELGLLDSGYTWLTGSSTNTIITLGTAGERAAIRVVNGATANNEKITLSISDLTLQYGAGREPATAAAFLAEYPEALTAPYNAGKLIPNKMTALVTDGFNQWDEVWEVGSINPSTGENAASSGNFRSTNYIPVLADVTYYAKAPVEIRIFYYNAAKDFISYADVSANTTFSIPAGCCFIRFRTSSGSTYTNDIAINLSHSGIRNGEYEPYWTSMLNIDHSKIYGKLNGAGEMALVAANGLRGVGSNYDEIDLVRKTADIKNTLINLGEMTYQKFSDNYGIGYELSASYCPKVSGQLLVSGTIPGVTSVAIIQSGAQYAFIIFYTDGRYADAAAFKSAVAGYQLIYERANSIHYTDLMYSEDGGQTFTELPSNYRVDDFGTERRLPDGLVDGAPASTPLVADIAYAMNAVDTLRRLPTNYLSKESTENLLAALQTAGVIAGYTITYDEDNAEYDFTITAPAGA